ncbi:MAG: Gfo/Idh/MocA family oxidoreductase [Candidatus Margulisiibacteriota bacterium]
MKKSRGLKIGVIGVGTMGQHHARICSLLPGIRLAAVADPDTKRAHEIGRRYGADVFKDYKEMFPLVEALIIVSPTETHFEIAEQCLNAGKNILVEKPLAKTSHEAQRLVELARSKNLILAVGLIERFNPAYQELSKLVRKEKIIGIHAKRFSPFPERITDADVVQDMMVHDLDLLVNLLPNDEIEDLKAEGAKVKSNKLDKVNTTIYFKSGIIAKVEADRVFGIKTRKIAVTTERTIIEADLLNKRVYIRDLQHHIPSVHHAKNIDQLTAELSDFIKAIKNKARPKVDAEDGHKVLKLAEEVERACS